MPSPEHTAGTPPVTNDQVPNLKHTRENVEKIVYGVPGNPRVGGHLFGVSRPAKSESPRPWTPARMLTALVALRDGYHWAIVKGDRRIRRIEIDGVIFELTWYSHPMTGVAVFRSFVPLCGYGVYEVLSSGQRAAKPLDRRLLQRLDIDLQ